MIIETNGGSFIFNNRRALPQLCPKVEELCYFLIGFDAFLIQNPLLIGHFPLHKDLFPLLNVVCCEISFSRALLIGLWPLLIGLLQAQEPEYIRT